jgi:hypothetical protein
MSVAVDFFGNPVLVRVACCKCSVEFGLMSDHNKRLLDTHASFYCPNGHGQHYTGPSEADKLKKTLALREQELKWARDGRDFAQKQERKSRTLATRRYNEKRKLEERIKNGVCPCCKRSFQNLRRHMETNHARG